MPALQNKQKRILDKSCNRYIHNINRIKMGYLSGSEQVKNPLSGTH